MRILQLCLRIPDPPGDGGTIAMRAIADSLMQAGATVKILAFNTKKHFVEPQKINLQFKQATSLESVYLDASVRFIPAFLNLFSRSSYHIQRFISKNFENKLIEVLKTNSFDIVQLESLYLSPYVDVIRKNSKAKIVLRAHNVEYLIWQRMAESCNSFLKKKYLSLLAGKLRNYEMSMLNAYDAILPITKEDENTFINHGCRILLYVTPFGVNGSAYPQSTGRKNDFSVFHLGSMDWLPNKDGVEWFLKNVYPALNQNHNPVKVFLAGNKMPENILRLNNKNLIVEGLIADAIEFMADKPVMIVPLLSGGGMRVKIIEGMMMGKTIISTRIGAEGISYEHLKNIIIADTPDEFIKWILACRNDPAFCSEIGREAANLAAKKYDNIIIGQQLYNFYYHELNQKSTFVS